MDVGGVRQRRHVARAMPGRAHAVLFGKQLQLARRRDTAHLAQVNADVVEETFGQQRAPFKRVIEQFPQRQRCDGLGAQMPQPIDVFQRNRVFQEEQFVRFELAGEADRLYRFQAFMHIVAQLHVETQSAAQLVEHLERLAHVLAAVQVNAIQRTLGRRRGGGAKAPTAIATALATDVGNALLAVLLDVVAQLLQVTAIGMAINRYPFAAFAAEQLVQRHVGLLALDVPQGHVHTRNGVVLNRPIAPVGVLVHQLPQFLNAIGIPTDQQRPQVFLDQAFDGEVAVGKGRAAQTNQAGLVGFNLHHEQVDAFRRGEYNFDIGNACGHRYLAIKSLAIEMRERPVQSTDSQPPST